MALLEQRNDYWKEIYTALRSRPENFLQVIEDLKKRFSDIHESFWKELLSQKDLPLEQYKRSLRDILRIDRNELVKEFALRLREITQKAENVETWRDNMLEAISEGYTELYALGSGGIVDKEVIFKQVQTQVLFLAGFGVALGVALQSGGVTDKLLHRAELYGYRGTALYELGALHKYDNEALIYWRLGVAEHCQDCIDRMVASPYLKKDLPSYPADGATQCKTNCKCRLEIA